MSGISRTAVAVPAIFSILVLAACAGGGVGGATGTPALSPALSPAASPSAPAATEEPTEEASPSAAASAPVLNQAILQFEAQNDSGITGGAILTDLGDGETAVTIGVVAVGFADPMPAHIHDGTCADLDPTPKYPLNDVTVGASNTVVAVSLDDLLATPHAVNIHKSAAEADVYVACAEITR